jgi:hypothetical protein
MNSTTASPQPAGRPQASPPATPGIPFRWPDVLLATALGLVWWFCSALGLAIRFLAYALLIGLAVGLVSLVIRFASSRSGSMTRTRRDWLLISGRSLFWLSAGLAISVGVVPLMFHSLSFLMVEVIVWSFVAALVAIEFARPIRTLIITSLVLTACGVEQLYEIARACMTPAPGALMEIGFPAKGTWLVVQGGLSSLVNHHYAATNQRHAIDLIRVEGEAIMRSDGTGLAAYRSWEEPIFSPADGRVAEVENELDDNPVGKTDRKHPVGNHLTIALPGGRYILIAHLRRGSVLPRVGDLVKKGEAVAKCGNSGNTAMPHIHLQIQTAAEFSAAKNETVPLSFSGLDEFNHSGASTRLRYPRRNDELRGK